jgi:hypothetical protein
MNQINEVINWEAKARCCREMYLPDLMSLLKADISVFWNWGAHNVLVDAKRGTKMFRMNVQGHHHKGHVYIFLNGADLFDVYLTTIQGTIKNTVSDLYFDQLVDWIDEKVERIPEYSK